jgi:hypothetical protein
MQRLRRPLPTVCHTCMAAHLDVSMFVHVEPVDVDEVDDNCAGVRLSAFAQLVLAASTLTPTVTLFGKLSCSFVTVDETTARG